MTGTLETRGLTKRFGGVVAVDGVDLDVVSGQLTSLVGPNGAGKSTTFACIGGQLKPSAGTVRWDGHDVTGLAPERMACLGISRSFQTSRPIPGFTVLENVLVGAHRLGRSTFIEDVFGGPRRAAEERELSDRAMRAIDQVGLSAVADADAEQLAYGQRRLLEIARALVGDPRILLLDEPAAGLNSAETDVLGRLLRRLVDGGLGVLLVEHNLRLVLAVSERVAVLDFGVLIADGPPEEIAEDERVLAAYLGGAGGADRAAG